MRAAWLAAPLVAAFDARDERPDVLYCSFLCHSWCSAFGDSLIPIGDTFFFVEKRRKCSQYRADCCARKAAAFFRGTKL